MTMMLTFQPGSNSQTKRSDNSEHLFSANRFQQITVTFIFCLSFCCNYGFFITGNEI